MVVFFSLKYLHCSLKFNVLLMASQANRMAIHKQKRTHIYVYHIYIYIYGLYKNKNISRMLGGRVCFRGGGERVGAQGMGGEVSVCVYMCVCILCVYVCVYTSKGF